MKLIVISPAENTTHENVLITQLFEAGLELFHLRKPGMNPVEMNEYITDIPSEHHHKIVIHSNYSLIEKYSLKGIHSNEPVEEKYRDKLVSRSVHSFEEIESLLTHYEYVFLGPVFDSISKPGYKGKIDLHKAKIFIDKSPIKTIALGGIDEKNIHSVNLVGFYGAALLGTIWKSDDPLTKYNLILNSLHQPAM